MTDGMADEPAIVQILSVGNLPPAPPPPYPRSLTTGHTSYMFWPSEDESGGMVDDDGSFMDGAMLRATEM